MYSVVFDVAANTDDVTFCSFDAAANNVHCRKGSDRRAKQ